MKTVEEMREYLKSAALTVKTRTEGDVHAITDVTNIDKQLLSRYRRIAAKEQNMLGDGYLAATMLEAILNQTRAMPCATLSARAVRHPNDVPDMMLGRDLARARAKKSYTNAQRRSLSKAQAFLYEMIWAADHMNEDLRSMYHDADEWENSLHSVIAHRAHVPALKGV